MQWINAISMVVTIFVLPYVVALLQRESWSAKTKEAVADAIAIVAGVAYVFTSGIDLAPVNAVVVVGTFAVGTRAAYMLFKANGITSKPLDAFAAIELTFGKTKTAAQATEAPAEATQDAEPATAADSTATDATAGETAPQGVSQ